jgi:hypothetical protein
MASVPAPLTRSAGRGLAAEEARALCAQDEWQGPTALWQKVLLFLVSRLSSRIIFPSAFLLASWNAPRRARFAAAYTPRRARGTMRPQCARLLAPRCLTPRHLATLQERFGGT